MRTKRCASPWLILAAACLAGPASAQSSGCRTTAFTDPPREVLDCGDVSISAEKGAAYRLVDGNRDGRPEAVELREKGVLIEVRRRPRSGFQVLTPHAVASVRGTTYAVDVKAAGTAVFVQTGRVGVTRAVGGQGAVLGAGDGVDVTAGGGPLVVKQWPPERRLGLLARFGR